MEYWGNGHRGFNIIKTVVDLARSGIKFGYLTLYDNSKINLRFLLYLRPLISLARSYSTGVMTKKKEKKKVIMADDMLKHVFLNILLSSFYNMPFLTVKEVRKEQRWNLLSN